MSLSGRHVIAGIGHTAFGKLPGSDTVSLNVEACRNALADAGIDKSLVDAVFVKVPTSAHQFMFGQKVADARRDAERLGHLLPEHELMGRGRHLHEDGVHQ